MLIAAVTHPPFGMKIKSVDDAAARSMPGIKDVITIQTLKEDYERNFFDTNSFNGGGGDWEYNMGSAER